MAGGVGAPIGEEPIAAQLQARPRIEWLSPAVDEIITVDRVEIKAKMRQSLEDSPDLRGPGFTMTNIARRFEIVNATFSNHRVLQNNWGVTPAISVPLQNGTDRQFNFEATLQLNYLR